MGLETITLAYIAAGTAAVGTAASLVQGRETAKSQEKAAEDTAEAAGYADSA